jgi:hypothetical protein
MTVLSNVSLFYSNASVVFSQQNVYTSMELYYAVLFLFIAFMMASLFLDGERKPFEKLFAALVGFVLSFSNALASFSLAIIKVEAAGWIQQAAGPQIIAAQQTALVPSIIMQNTMTWQIASWIIMLLCFVNVINCILVLMDYSRIKAVKRNEF